MRNCLRGAASLCVLLAFSGLSGGDFLKELLKGFAIGAAVRETAGPLDKGINSLLKTRDAQVGADTKVVPAFSLGTKGYAGGAQVAAHKDIVAKVRAVGQYETEFDDGRYRIKLLVPTTSSNPFKLKRVRGAGVSALVDVALSRGTYSPPSSGGIRAGDIFRGGVIAVAVKEFGPKIDRFINTLTGSRGGTIGASTRVVPYLSVGEKTYLGAMQIVGPAAAVRKTQLVLQYEDLFDAGRMRLRALVPIDRVNPFGAKRVGGVGVSAVIDTVLATAVAPDRFTHIHYVPLRDSAGNWYMDLREHEHSLADFKQTGRWHPDSPMDFAWKTHPPGWDVGRKVGWRGGPMPPGLWRKTMPGLMPSPQPARKPIVILKPSPEQPGAAYLPGQKKEAEEQEKTPPGKEKAPPGKSKGPKGAKGKKG
jgi:hypothetical protein